MKKLMLALMVAAGLMCFGCERPDDTAPATTPAAGEATPTPAAP